MKRLIVDYKKLTPEILSLLVEKYPDGYGDRDIIVFKNLKNETIEAVEVRNDDTIYLVKVSTRLANRMENYDEDDVFDDFSIDDVVPPIKDIDMTDDDDFEDNDDDDDETEINKDPDVFISSSKDTDDDNDDADDFESDEDEDDVEDDDVEEEEENF